MNTATIDERIRKTANDELKQEIKRALDPIRKMASVGYAISVAVPNREKRDAPPALSNVHTLFDIVEEALFKEMYRVREEQAISEFLDKIQSLQSQINELRDEVGEAVSQR